MAHLAARAGCGRRGLYLPLDVGDSVRLRTNGDTEWMHGTYDGDRGRSLVLGLVADLVIVVLVRGAISSFTLPTTGYRAPRRA